MQPVQVDQVESADGNAVQEHRAHAVQERRIAHQRKDAIGGIGSIDRHRGTQYAFDVVRGRKNDSHEPRPPGGPHKRAVVEPNDPQVRLRQRPGENYRPPAAWRDRMATPVELRCPKCGTRLTAYTLYPHITSYTRCPQCGTVLPFVAPRDPAPLYSWEIYPGLYPPTPVPRPPDPRRRLALLALLLAATLLIVVVGGIFAWMGSDALRPGSMTIGGTILPSTARGAWVEVQGENGFYVNVSAPVGTFSIPGVPYGGVEVSAGATGYGVTQIELFYSPVYSSISGSPSAIQIGLSPANGSSESIVDTTPFPDLENFVASVWSGTGLLWILAALTGAGWASARRDKFPLIVIGGVSAMGAPFVLPILGIDIISLATTVSALVALPVGLVVLILAVPELARAQPPVESM